jgi:hypothetical protein
VALHHTVIRRLLAVRRAATARWHESQSARSRCTPGDRSRATAASSTRPRIGRELDKTLHRDFSECGTPGTAGGTGPDDRGTGWRAVAGVRMRPSAPAGNAHTSRSMSCVPTTSACGACDVPTAALSGSEEIQDGAILRLRTLSRSSKHSPPDTTQFPEPSQLIRSSAMRYIRDRCHADRAEPFDQR